MMKRYRMDPFLYDENFPSVDSVEDGDGEWVKYEDAKAEREEMLGELIWIYSRTQTGFINNCDEKRLKLIIEKVTGKSIQEVLK